MRERCYLCVERLESRTLLASKFGGIYPVGGLDPVAVVAADLGNGKIDLVTANAGSNNLSVLLGNGDRTFQAPRIVPLDFSPSSLAVADLYNNGKPDLLVGHPDNGDINVLLGDGKGGFGPGPTLHTDSTGSASLAVADFNHDGLADLVVANAGRNDVSVLLNNGRGGLVPAPGSPFATGGKLSRSVSVADFNLDGNPDLVVANEGSNNVSVLLGDGKGGFTPARNSPFDTGGTEPINVLAADTEMNGKPTIAVGNEGSNNASFLLNDGTANFTPAPGSPFTLQNGLPISQALVDLTGNGLLDQVLLTKNSPVVIVLINDGSVTTITNALTQITFAAGLTGNSGLRSPAPSSAVDTTTTPKVDPPVQTPPPVANLSLSAVGGQTNAATSTISSSSATAGEGALPTPLAPPAARLELPTERDIIAGMNIAGSLTGAGAQANLIPQKGDSVEALGALAPRDSESTTDSPPRQLGAGQPARGADVTPRLAGEGTLSPTLRPYLISPLRGPGQLTVQPDQPLLDPTQADTAALDALFQDEQVRAALPWQVSKSVLRWWEMALLGALQLVAVREIDRLQTSKRRGARQPLQ
jgi:hypothetical protein